MKNQFPLNSFNSKTAEESQTADTLAAKNKRSKKMYIASAAVGEIEIKTVLRRVFYALHLDGVTPREEFFDRIVANAWINQEEAWNAIKLADEVYTDTSLVALGGNSSYNGSVALFDALIKKAVTHKLTGKSIFIVRPSSEIQWRGIDLSMLPAAFEKNRLFTLEGKKFQQVDVNKLILEVTTERA